MSRIRFEWNIESQRIDRSDGEDPLAKRRRRRNALVLLLLIALLIAVFVVGALLVRQRLIDIEIQVAQLLQDTVKAEIAALRIDDINSFLSIQAGSDEWRDRQRLSFQQYSELKAKGQIVLTGSILSVDIDEERARVLVQENINDLPYARLWFYRRVENSWFHIAPDFAFWGDDRLYHAEHVVVRYRAADDRFARQLGDSLAEWMQQACEIFACVDMPSLTVNIDTNTADAVSWADEAAMQLVIRSPYTDIARADTPFDSLLRLRVSRLLAERIINAQSDYLAITYPSDASFLRNAMIAWLSERFTRIDSGARLSAFAGRQLRS